MKNCIEYQGCRKSNGYGWVTYKGKQMGAHRKAWIEANGEIPKGMYVLHKCDNPPCINIDHLFLGTPADNISDMVQKKRNRTGTALRQADGLPVRSKLTKNDVCAIKELRSTGMKQRDIAARFNVTQSCISLLLSGKVEYVK